MAEAPRRRCEEPGDTAGREEKGERKKKSHGRERAAGDAFAGVITPNSSPSCPNPVSASQSHCLNSRPREVLMFSGFAGFLATFPV